MDDTEWLAERFEEHRPRLRSVAYRMLGSIDEAEDAVQNAWLRLSRFEADEIDNLSAWLTTVVARGCLQMLRSRRRRREDVWGDHLPDPIVSVDQGVGPEQEALLADSVGLAMLVVLESLSPAERVAFVLHDMFQLPFDEIAPMVGRTPSTTRQLASRARRRVKGAKVARPDPGLAGQRRVVDAFFAAAREGNFDALLEVLDPDVVARSDAGPDRTSVAIHGVSAVARLARAPRGAQVRPVLVNGTIGALVTIDGRPTSIMAFTVADGRIVEIDGYSDPDRVRRAVAGLEQE